MMPHLLPLAILLLSIIPTETKVVASVKECNKFFLDKTPPYIPGILEGGNILDQNRYKVICQTFSNTRTFVTLYDTKNKIPVFSAAKYRGRPGGKRPKINWMIEPQLEKPADDDNMRQADNNIIYKNQAVNTDYKPYNQQGFDRGHLFPSSYGSDPTEKSSTFTLTNAVPQKSRFNRVRWRNMENCVKKFLDTNCINDNNRMAFVVIGAKPRRSASSESKSSDNKSSDSESSESKSSGSESSLLKKNKIHIPSVLWSAFCCYSSSQKKWVAGAHWSKNRDDCPIHLRTLEDLEKKLSIEAFPGKKCSKHTTLTQVYSKYALKSKRRNVVVSHKVPRKHVGKKKVSWAKKRKILNINPAFQKKKPT
ncbi:endonuclease domain-containing 1 protein-like isoform X2 [Oreochromis aureus]|nr:endonuclease domain-containing 1 protein-like isoform X2 [Oreochromis aureus]